MEFTGNKGYTAVRYKIKCSKCGQEATVPFEPKQGKAVYCKQCYVRLYQAGKRGL